MTGLQVWQLIVTFVFVGLAVIGGIGYLVSDDK
jgi:preprotein translocase subunit Sss1